MKCVSVLFELLRIDLVIMCTCIDFVFVASIKAMQITTNNTQSKTSDGGTVEEI